MVKRQANKAARLLKELAEAETHTILSQGGNKWHANKVIDKIRTQNYKQKRIYDWLKHTCIWKRKYDDLYKKCAY